MKFTLIFFAILLIVSGSMYSCQKSDERAGIELPAHFPPIRQPIDLSEITSNKVRLGKMLFFDPILSLDSTIACASCHQQEAAFSHIDHDVSHGIFDRLGSRNAPALQNLLWEKEFFWDGGVHHMDFISPNPIENEVEMGETIQSIVRKLNRHPRYKSLFSEAFQRDSIDVNQILEVFTAFQATLISSNSPFDDYLRGNTSALSESEIQGYALFQSKCGTCHSGVLFTDNSYRNNGLTLDNTSDVGRYGITLKPEDKGKFKVPSLRNVAVSQPYMHHGRLSSLSAVLEHYQRGIKPNPSLDNLLVDKISMTDKEKELIISFLHTLTDQKFLKNPAFKPE
ncbi:MAG: cytochrome-c peroxidase [Chitinophagales bacterium]|jgi:cytochrome c peroxidase|nr:cytochrome-c peroxidase [Chitinophagales bacterium]